MERVPRSIAERRVFVDTSAFLSLADIRDRFHSQARDIVDRLSRGRFQLVTTRYIVVETHSRMLSVLGTAVARTFLRQFPVGGVAVMRTEEEDETRAEAIIFTYQDKSYSLCDAISFAVMERLGIRLAFAFDDHFRQHGFSTPLERPAWP